MELDRHVSRSLHLEDARRQVVVERDLAVRVVVCEQYVVAAAHIHRALEVLERRDGRGRVVGVVEVDQPRPGQLVGWELLELDQEVLLRSQRYQLRLGIGQQRSTDVGGVARIGHHAHVARIEHGEPQVEEPFLAADERQQLIRGIEGHAEAPLDVAGCGPPELREPHLERVAAHRGVTHGLAQRLDRDRRRREIGVPRTEIDHVDALGEHAALDHRKFVNGVLRKTLESGARTDHAGAPIP